MIKHIKDELVYFTFEHFDKTGLIKHCFSTRRGGVSTGRLSSLNLGFSRGDDRQNVLRNYGILCGELGINTENLIMSRQTHTTNVMYVTREHRGYGIYAENPLTDIDGLTTDQKDAALVTFYADCVPLLFLDPINKAIASSHAGWRGTLNKMAAVTVLKMKEFYGTKAEELLVGIGPCIGRCCFEVDEPVYSLFEKEHGRRIVKTSEHKRNIDLKGVNYDILIECGVPSENIEVSDLCTKCDGELFYSHRAMGDKRGSLAAIMELV